MQAVGFGVPTNPGAPRSLPAFELLNALVYFLATIALVARMTDETMLLWPANAIAIALLVRRPRLNWTVGLTALFVAGALANRLGSDAGWNRSLLIAFISVAAVAASAWLLRHPLKRRVPLPHVSLDQGLLLGALCILAFPALRALPLAMAGDAQSLPDLWRSAAHNWLSGAVGACLFAPPIYLYSRPALDKLLAPPALAENLSLMLVSCAATYLAIRYVRFPFVVIGLPMTLIAFRMGAFGTACLSTMTGLLVIALWYLGFRPRGLDATALSGGASLPFPALAATLLGPLMVGLALDDRRAAEFKLRTNERQFRESIDCSPIGMVLADLNGVWTKINPAFTRMLGYVESDGASLPAGHLLHPEERAEIDGQMHRLATGVIDVYEGNRRYRHKDGHWVWVRVTVSLGRDELRRPTHYFAQIESIEHRLHAEAKLLAERKRLETTLCAIVDAVITTDEHGMVTYANPAAVDLLRQPLGALEGRRLDEVLVLTDPDSAKPLSDQLGLCTTHLRVMERRDPCLLHRPDGGICHITETVSPVLDKDGRFGGAVVVIRDATAIQERTSELNHRATHDVLTDLSNRFGFAVHANASLERARHLDRPSVILMLDLDRFKQVNDRGGHAAGDAMLKRVAATLSAEVRGSDVVARLGGDEFAVLLSGCPTERALLVGEKILRAVSAIRLDWEGQQFAVGVSIGAAAASAAFENAAAWLSAADGACYEAKSSGRARLQFASATRRAG